MISGIGLLDSLGKSQLGGGIGAGVAPSVSPAGGATSFAEALGEAATRTIGSLDKAEAMSMQALQGEVQTREVVDAVMNAEQSLQAAIAIRDKIVTAYLEISRMAI
jgi:flagellar hook-basal body complex protein FliE